MHQREREREREMSKASVSERFRLQRDVDSVTVCLAILHHIVQEV